LVLKLFILVRKGRFGEKSEKEVAIFLIFALMFLRFKKAISYQHLSTNARLLGQFLNQLGYKSIPTGNDTAISIPYAIQAGMGELGRNWMLITPKYGPRVRLCKVFTNLPLVCDEPIEFGVTELCAVCRKCADNCPVQAIPYVERTTEPVNKSNAGGSLKWYLDLEKCFKFWAKNTCDCGNCIRV
jgi:epoxyqueuosine reductase